MVTISEEHAYSLSRMAKWFQSMIVERGIGTSELTEGHCEELIEALKVKQDCAGDIVNGVAMRDIKAGEMITVNVNELRRLEHEQ